MIKEVIPMAKKSTSKKTAKKTAKPDEFFFLADGRVAKNIKELAFMLDDISHDVFGHHVCEARNDFASWVDTVFDEKELSEVLRLETEIAKLQMQLFRHLAKKHA